MTFKIIVVGAGAVGLSTAVQLQKCFPSAKVKIVAEKFYTETTSYGAAGLCRPTFEKVPGVPFETYRQWLDDSWKYYDSLAHSSESKDAGVSIVSGFEFYNEERDASLERAIIYDHRDCTEKEMAMFPGPKYSTGFRATTLMVECRNFLPYLMKQFKINGGIIEKRTLSSLSELVGHCDIIMNCCGLNSRVLVGDDKTFASRGHVFRVKAPWVKHFIYSEDGKGNYLWIYPGIENVIVGGTKQPRNEDLTPKPEERKAILKRAHEIMPSLKKAEPVSEWVGLRPMRSPLRLELEQMKFDNGSIMVIHNYGHGGEGVNLSWGTACHGVRLAQQYFEGKISKLSKL